MDVVVVEVSLWQIAAAVGSTGSHPMAVGVAATVTELTGSLDT